MAKSKKTDLYEAKPKPDVYMVLLIITFLGMTAATALMYVEYNALSP
ncbi:MAG: hypothetical protein U1D30_21525 [Planctomycetota bacterium]